jgi:hypothetical protein
MNTKNFNAFDDLEIINTPIDQINNKDLILTLMQCPTWYPVNYIEGGIYDRCFQNMKDHAKDTELTDNHIYEWYHIPEPKKSRTVFLQRPGKIPGRKKKFYVNKHGRIKESFIWTNIVKLNMYFYRSGSDQQIIAYTFGDKFGDRIIKPLKIIKHNWTTKSDLKWVATIVNDDPGYPIIWKCETCGLKGSSAAGSLQAIEPVEPLTCDEAMIKDIIL